jgi:hypothetical protein
MSTPVSYQVIARDNQGVGAYNQVQSNVTIGVNDVNEANAMPGNYSFTIAENVALGTQVGAVAATDPDSPAAANGQQRYYFWNGSAAVSTSSDGRYAIDAVSGAIRTAAAVDYETMTAPVDYTVIARDNAGNSPSFQATSIVRIGVSNVNETPNAPGGPVARFADESGVGSGNAAQGGSVFATYALADPDGSVPSLHFAANGNPGNWFTIAGNQVLFSNSFDFEWARAYGFAISDYNGDGRQDAFIGNVVVQASDGQLVSGTASTAFYLSDVNERPSGVSLQGQALHSKRSPAKPATRAASSRASAIRIRRAGAGARHHRRQRQWLVHRQRQQPDVRRRQLHRRLAALEHGQPRHGQWLEPRQRR